MSVTIGYFTMRVFIVLQVLVLFVFVNCTHSKTESPPKNGTDVASEALDPISSVPPEDKNDAARKKKSATATVCVEIRPSGPYQRPFQICEPAESKQYVPAPAVAPVPSYYAAPTYEEVKPTAKPAAAYEAPAKAYSAPAKPTAAPAYGSSKPYAAHSSSSYSSVSYRSEDGNEDMIAGDEDHLDHSVEETSDHWARSAGAEYGLPLSYLQPAMKYKSNKGHSGVVITCQPSLAGYAAHVPTHGSGIYGGSYGGGAYGSYRSAGNRAYGRYGRPNAPSYGYAATSTYKSPSPSYSHKSPPYAAPAYSVSAPSYSAPSYKPAPAYKPAPGFIPSYSAPSYKPVSSYSPAPYKPAASSYSVPAYKPAPAPVSSYSAPAPSYKPALVSSYSAPSYGAPEPYSVPSPSYSAAAPVQPYSALELDSSYSVPAPASSYSAPAPASSYGAPPQPSYATPSYVPASAPTYGSASKPHHSTLASYSAPGAYGLAQNPHNAPVYTPPPTYRTAEEPNHGEATPRISPNKHEKEQHTVETMAEIAKARESGQADMTSHINTEAPKQEKVKMEAPTWTNGHGEERDLQPTNVGEMRTNEQMGRRENLDENEINA